MIHDRHKPLLSLTQIKQAMQARGSHFWDRDTMRSFRSRAYDDVYPTWCGTYFITSEKDRDWYCSSQNTMLPGAWENRRRYTVRFIASRPCVSYSLRDGETVPAHLDYSGEYPSPYPYLAERGELIDTHPDAFGLFGTLNAARGFARAEQARLGGHPLTSKPELQMSS
jgi:hypothetical protein